MIYLPQIYQYFIDFSKSVALTKVNPYKDVRTTKGPAIVTVLIRYLDAT